MFTHTHTHTHTSERPSLSSHGTKALAPLPRSLGLPVPIIPCLNLEPRRWGKKDGGMEERGKQNDKARGGQRGENENLCLRFKKVTAKEKEGRNVQCGMKYLHNFRLHMNIAPCLHPLLLFRQGAPWCSRCVVVLHSNTMLKKDVKVFLCNNTASWSFLAPFNEELIQSTSDKMWN